MFDKIFPLPQMKRGVINNKYGIYELPQELPNNLRPCIYNTMEI